ncbi:hypothetical protein [Kineosporia sp. NBRC 101731]|uniref:hypothetical protein n=1 Tax=Kineosporia sp. NBRC 101731 TaxID=3032199 RepID=UPI0024A3D17E|nr:hypothetical protein [Kineosporia sp. NBRC 101731]GLY32786.1 hypothetical protein Kisp02_61510 [Kineosporia sp. NBRC 101731]
MRAREFFEVVDADDPRVPFTVRDYEAMTHRDMGRQLVAFRAWPTWRRVGLVLLVHLVVAGPFLVWPGLRTDQRVAGGVMAGCLTSVPYVVLTVVGAFLCKQRVCTNGLVLGWRRGRLVVPWETIDPGRVHVVENVPAAGLYPEFAGILPTHQAGFADRGLVVCGYNSGTREPMFSYWLLGSRSPEKLARVMEDAMVNAGFAAEGLAGNASRTAVRARRAVGRAGTPLLPPVRGPLDPVIGVPRPGRQPAQ